MKLLRRISIIICFLLFCLSSLLLGLDMCGLIKHKDTNAITNIDTKSYVKVDEIWDGNEFKSVTTNQLLQMVANNSSVSMDDISLIRTQALNKRTAEDMRDGTTLKSRGKDIVVRFGGLDWQVMYLSTDKSGNPILTLWLSSNYQEAWAGRNDNISLFDGFYNGGYFSDWSRGWSSADVSNSYPSNMYGTSYVRAIALNNGGNYASSVTSLTYINGYPKSTHPFAKFTMSSVTGNVTEYIVKPEQVAWQERGQNTQSYGSPYNMSNENWSTSVGDTGFYSSTNNYAHKAQSDNWKNDYLWLPSCYELGYTNPLSRWSGLWGASDNQKASYKSSHKALVNTSVGLSDNSGSTYEHTMTRSACMENSNQGNVIMVSRSRGDLYSSLSVSNSFAVRPAFHLNLNKIENIKKYNIEWKWTDEGTYADKTQDAVEMGASIEFPSPTKTGYRLTAWNHDNTTYSTDSNGKLTLTIPYLGDNVTSKKRFTAVWTARRYNVTLDNQGADILNGTAGVRVTYDSILPNITPPQKRGYTFKGYYTSPGGGGKQYYNSSGGNIVESDGQLRVWKETTVTTLYAYWTANSYTIEFDSNGGNGAMDEIEYAYSSSVSLPPCSFTKFGSIFMYWEDKYGNTYKDLDTIPVNRYAEDITLTAQWQKTWADSEYSSGSLSGNGTKDNPYLIQSEKDLGFLSRKVQEEGTNNGHYNMAYYKQTAHLDLSEHYWFPIGGIGLAGFRGIYDGQNYSISGVNTYSNTNANGILMYTNVGLFGYTIGAQLYNIKLLYGEVSGYMNVGGLVGFAKTGLIENCLSYVNVTGQQFCGMIGQGEGITIRKCYNHGNITGKNSVGGIVGGILSISSTLTDCLADCTIINSSGSKNYVAGILGLSSASTTIQNSAFKGTIIGTGYIIAEQASSTTIINCYAECGSEAELIASIEKITSTIYYVKEQGYYYEGGGDFTNWTMYNGKPLPGGLTWIGELELENEIFLLGIFVKND